MACPAEEVSELVALWVLLGAICVAAGLLVWTVVEDVLVRGKKWNC